jgi:superoxide dismutase, Fe-Mn family
LTRLNQKINKGTDMEKSLDRRDFMKTTALAGAGLALASAGVSSLFGNTAETGAAAAPRTITMIKLPYAGDALMPWISAKTVDTHYNKHHQSYYDLLKGYVETHPDYQNMTLEDILIKCKGGIFWDEAMFDISVLLYNHNWYWPSLRPKGGGAPKGEIEKRIIASYGSYDAFRKTFINEAMKLGVGWVWVVQDGEKVVVYRSEYHDTPLVKGLVPLLAVDVWEHAYYLDYLNDRRKYVEVVLDNLLNWEFAEKNLAKKTATR